MRRSPRAVTFSLTVLSLLATPCLSSGDAVLSSLTCPAAPHPQYFECTQISTDTLRLSRLPDLLSVTLQLVVRRSEMLVLRDPWELDSVGGQSIVNDAGARAVYVLRQCDPQVVHIEAGSTSELYLRSRQSVIISFSRLTPLSATQSKACLRERNFFRHRFVGSGVPLIDACVRRLTDAELPGAASLLPDQSREVGAEDGESQAGKVLHCLGRVAAVRTAAVYFLGVGKHTGATSLARGLSISEGGWSLHVAEGQSENCILAREAMAQDAHIISTNLVFHCAWVPAGASWARRNICPSGELDLFVLDPDLDTPVHLFESVLEACLPRLVFVENSCFYPQPLGLIPQPDHWTNHSEFSRWNSELHDRALRGEDEYRLVIDNSPSFLARAEYEDPPRVHSLYEHRGRPAKWASSRTPASTRANANYDNEL